MNLVASYLIEGRARRERIDARRDRGDQRGVRRPGLHRLPLRIQLSFDLPVALAVRAVATETLTQHFREGAAHRPPFAQPVVVTHHPTLRIDAQMAAGLALCAKPIPPGIRAGGSVPRIETGLQRMPAALHGHQRIGRIRTVQVSGKTFQRALRRHGRGRALDLPCCRKEVEPTARACAARHRAIVDCGESALHPLRAGQRGRGEAHGRSRRGDVQAGDVQPDRVGVVAQRCLQEHAAASTERGEAAEHAAPRRQHRLAR